MSGTISLASLPAFLEVVRHGSFTRAAEALSLPKSTVSRHVRKLEEELGTALLVRTTRSLRLTEDGEIFHRRVAGALDAVDEAVRALAEQHETPRGHLRISVPSDFDRLSPLLASFVERYPEVRLEVSVTPRLVDLVAEGFDLAIRAGKLRDSSLVARRLSRVEFHLFASEAYLEAHGEPASLEALSERDCVLFRPVQDVCRWTLDGPNGSETVEVRGPVAVDDLLLARGLVVSGVGVGLLPEGMFEDRLDSVRRVLPSYAMGAGAVHVVYPGSRHLPAKVRAFRDHLLEHSL